MEKLEVKTYRAEPEIHAKAVLRAKKENTNLSEVIRRFLNDYTKERRRFFIWR